jgi:putative NADPH-quinone reductase
MSRNIAVIQGHPDPQGHHFCHALAQTYIEGAKQAGHLVREINVARLEFPLLRNIAEYRDKFPPADIVEAQEKINWADHLVFVYPLWLGSVPALLKGFLEQAFREDFIVVDREDHRQRAKPLQGKSARLVVTMGMPAWWYRLYFGAYGTKSFERSVLAFAGIAPVRQTLIGSVESRGSASRGRWLLRVQQLGGDAR